MHDHVSSNRRSDFGQRVSRCRDLILLNLAAGRHHYDGMGSDLSDPGMCARIELLEKGYLERVGQQGLARCRFRLTQKGEGRVAFLRLTAPATQGA